MLEPERLNPEERRKIQVACAYLFSGQEAADNVFLTTLTLESVKNAYRGKVKRYHPDLHVNESHEMLSRRRERFIRIHESYELLAGYLKPKVTVSAERRNPIQEGRPGHQEKRKRFVSEEPLVNRASDLRRIIAVGGAKGGVGKSLLAANMGVFLSQRGYKTILVDLDLGGANLHLYLGEAFLPHTINDYLHKKVPCITDTIMATKYGPWLIGGDSSQLGTANIGFARKKKILRDLKELDADYIIFDLGGDTAYNVLDFFLAADYGIVLTTCDPAAYLDAYTFIKVALYRKLNRMFSDSPEFMDHRDAGLEKIIREGTDSGSGLTARSVDELKNRINNASHRALIDKLTNSFKPGLVVNRATAASDPQNIVQRISTVAEKKFATRVTHLGTIPHSPDVEQSARSLVPEVARHRDGALAQAIDIIITHMHRCSLNSSIF